MSVLRKTVCVLLAALLLAGLGGCMSQHDGSAVTVTVEMTGSTSPADLTGVWTCTDSMDNFTVVMYTLYREDGTMAVWMESGGELTKQGEGTWSVSGETLTQTWAGSTFDSTFRVGSGMLVLQEDSGAKAVMTACDPLPAMSE